LCGLGNSDDFAISFGSWSFGVGLVVQHFIPNLKKTGFNRGRPPQPPKQARQPKDKFALNRGFRIIVRCYGAFERLIVVGIFEQLDDSFGGQSMADGILRGALLAGFGFGAGTLLRISAVGFDLSQGSHVGRPGSWVRFVVFIAGFSCEPPGTISDAIAVIRTAVVPASFDVLAEPPMAWVSSQSLRATPAGSIRVFAHQSSSLPAR